MLVQCDASALEWRVCVDLCNDKTGILEIKSGLDTHSLNQEAFSLPSRLIAKIYLFRTIYRGSGYAFAKDHQFKHVSTDPAFWDDINNKFYRKYSGINEQHNKWGELVYVRRPIVGPTGRQWPIEMGTDRHGNEVLPWTVLTNYPVQGTSADIMSIARVSLSRRLQKAGLVGKVISSVHDSIIIDCPKEELDKISEMMYSVFEDLPKNALKLFGWKMNVPYACEVKFGDNLTDMQKYIPTKYRGVS